MHCNQVSFQALLDCFDNDLDSNAWNLDHNAEYNYSKGNSEQNYTKNNEYNYLIMIIPISYTYKIMRPGIKAS